MSLGPFLRRELTTSVRSSRAFSDRRYALFLMAGLLVFCFVIWDWNGFDRASVAGAHRFSIAMFAAVGLGMWCLAVGIIVRHVTSGIASERSKKSLDALLASRFSGVEIVLGAMASGLFRFANAALAGTPLVVLVVFLGGVPPSWLILSAFGLGSLALLIAAFGVMGSVRGRNETQALNLALSPFVIWAILPSLFVLLRPLVWPSAPPWLTSAVLTLVDGSPLGLIINLGGIIPRPGGPLDAVLRMMAWQLAGTLLLVAWAIIRLRPVSRGLYDVEGEKSRIKQIKAAMRRPPRRPPCFDDSVLWYEMYSTVGQTRLKRLISVTLSLITLVGLAWLTWWFVKPAFHELVERGYRPSPEAFRMPDIEPFARLLVAKMFPNIAGMAASPATGQARLEFNIVLREFSGMFFVGFMGMAFSYAYESLKGEQKRDTWLGLIATPLTAWEILRGKTLGSLWKTRGAVSTLLALWTLGLLTGALHPLGLLAAIAFLAVTAAFFAALGVWMALLTSNPEKPPGDLGFSTIQIPLVLVGTILLTGGPMVLAFTSLFTYEDIQATIQTGPFPEFRDSAISTVLGARAVLTLWLIATTALAVGTVWLTRANVRGFDKAIGRPTRPESPVDAPNPTEVVLAIVESA